MKQTLFFLALAITTIAADSPELPHPLRGVIPYISAMEQAQKALGAIRPGMGRSDVDALFAGLDDGPQSVYGTRYVQESGFLIHVPYDQRGGFWSPENKVNGLPKMTTGSWHRTPSSKL